MQSGKIAVVVVIDFVPAVKGWCGVVKVAEDGLLVGFVRVRGEDGFRHGKEKRERRKEE